MFRPPMLTSKESVGDEKSRFACSWRFFKPSSTISFISSPSFSRKSGSMYNCSYRCMPSTLSTWTPPASKPAMRILFTTVCLWLVWNIHTHRKEHRVLQHQDDQEFWWSPHTLICQQSSHQ